MRPAPLSLALGLLLLAPALPRAVAQDPWKELAAKGTRATRALESVRKGGTKALLQLLTSGLVSENPKVRSFAAQLLPLDLLGEADLARLFTVLLADWEKEAQEPPFSEAVQEGLNDLVSESFRDRTLASLAEVAGWGDQERLVQALRGPSPAGSGAWGAAGKKGRELREKLAQLLYSTTDARAQGLAAQAILDSSWDPQERALIFWIALPARDGGAYPGDEVTRARLKSLLADRPDKPVRSLPLARLTQATRNLPFLTGHPEALGPIRKALIESPDGANQDLLWATLRLLIARSPREVREKFWAEGREPFNRLLQLHPDPLLFLSIAPALGGWSEVARPAKELAPILNAQLGAPLRDQARNGLLTNDLFQALLWLEDQELLSGVLDAAPPEDLDALLEAPLDLIPTLRWETAEKLAASTNPRTARVGQVAMLAWKDQPESQPDPVLARLADSPDLQRVGVLAACLKRGIPLKAGTLIAWWNELVADESPEAIPLAREFPDSFRDYLTAVASDPDRFQAALSWCTRNKIAVPFQAALPVQVREALEALPGPGADPELPLVLGTLAPWLTQLDRDSLAQKWLAAWTEHPTALDAGDAAADLAILSALFEGKPDALERALLELLAVPTRGRVAETALGGLIRMGRPPSAEVIAALLEAGLKPTRFLALHTCPVRPLLPRIQEALQSQGEDGWELFLQICWGAWAGPGPGPTLPTPSGPSPEWWDLAQAGHFTQIYAALAERATEDQDEPLLRSALQGLALSAREEPEKARAWALIQPFLAEPHQGHYWTAVLTAAYLGDKHAKSTREEAITAGRSFFVHSVLLPWAALERSRELADLLLDKGLPSSGLIRSQLPTVLGTLIPTLDPLNLPGGPSWARAAQKKLDSSSKELVWDAVPRAWKVAP